MLERVARAISPIAWGDVDDDWVLPGVKEDHRRMSLLAAKRVLAAMHEPTRHMEDSGDEYLGTMEAGWVESHRVWQAMINAVSEEQAQ